MKILVVAPHADDETLGVGGTIARHASNGDHVTVAVVTGHGGAEHFLGPPEMWEHIREEARNACMVLGVEELVFRELPAARLSSVEQRILNQEMLELVELVQPELVYVPFPYDLHRDHREVFHSMSVAWRPSSDAGRRIREILAYEVQSETHWNVPYLEPGFTPHVWVDTSEFLEAKLRAVQCYVSQIPEWPHARSAAAVEHLARWRGSQVGVKAAEGFVVVRQLR